MKVTGFNRINRSAVRLEIFSGKNQVVLGADCRVSVLDTQLDVPRE